MHETTVQMELDQIRSRDVAALPPHDPRIDDFKIPQASLAHDEAPVSRGRFRLVAIIGALYLSLFIAALDVTVVSTAIPTISAHFHSASGYTWIGGAYLLANAATGPIWAKLSDIWGRKPIVLAAIALFFLSSIVCATSITMAMLIAGRSIQGAAAGGLILLANICVSDLFDMRRRSLVLGSLECVWATAGAVGPIIGGAFAELASWRWIWYLNLPLAGFAFLMILLFLDVHNPKTKIWEGMKAIDWFGTVTMLGVTLMTLLGLDFGGETFPWNSPKVICLIVFGVLMSALFIFSEAKLARYPLIPLRLFRQGSNVAALAVCFVHGFVFVSAEYYLPLYFQSVQEASPLRSGILILPIIVTEASMGILSGVFIHRTGRYLELIWVGTTFMTLGFGLLIKLNAESTLREIIPFQIVAGIGSGLLFEPPLIALQTLVTQDDTATATATFGFIRNIGLVLSIVIGGVVFQNGMSLRAPLLRASGLPSNITDQFSGGAAAANVMIISTLQDPAQKLVVKEAFAWSLRNMWILYTSGAVCGIVATAFISKQVLGREHTETTTGLKKESEPEEA